MKKHAWLASTAGEYEKLGLKKGVPEHWEDGLRTDGSKGSYEWWYFDSKLEDGSSLVIVFYPGPMFSFEEGFKPHATFSLTKADGERYESVVNASVENSSFAKDLCYVIIGDCIFREVMGEDDLRNYEIYWTDDKIEASVTLKGRVPAWRPECGHILFGDKNYFAWLPSVVEGSVEVVITDDNGSKTIKGTGYHDHNWGNIPMFFLMHHWYWGRAKIGDYQAVTSFITAAPKYSYDETPIFMLAKDGKILADQPEKYLTYSEEDIYFDSVTKKHVAGKLVYDYDDGTQHYKITYIREADIEQVLMSSQVNKLQLAAIWLMGMRGSYHRMTGTVKLERFEEGKVVEEVTGPALWELMYFGKDEFSTRA